MLASTSVAATVPQLVYVSDWKAAYRVLCTYYLCLIVENIIPEHLPILEKPTFLLLKL